MKNLCFFVFLMIGMLSANTIDAQNGKANNYSDEDWSINFYGAITPVPAGTIGVTVTVGTDCTQGISVINQSLSCSNVFTAPSTWAAPCTNLTGDVIFDASVGNSSLQCPGQTLYVRPEFVFTRP